MQQLSDNDYNQAVMGTIDFQISYDNKQTSRKTIVRLINDAINTLNTKYKELNSNGFDIHFHLDNIEDEIWFELNGLIHLSFERYNKEKTPLFIIHNYLTSKELDRFSILTSIISKETSKE